MCSISPIWFLALTLADPGTEAPWEPVRSLVLLNTSLPWMYFSHFDLGSLTPQLLPEVKLYPLGPYLCPLSTKFSWDRKSWYRATVPVPTLGVCDHLHNTLWQGLATRTTSPWHSQPGQTPSNPAKDPLWFQSTLDVSFPIWKQSLPDQLQGTSVGHCAKGFLVPGWAQWVLKSTTSYTLSVTFCQRLHFEAERKGRRDNPS